MPRQLTPTSFEAAAAALSGAAAGGEAVRIAGGGTKAAWGALTRVADVEVHTTKLNRIVEHNAGDLTAVLEAGVPLAEAQAQFGSAGQMLPLDPVLGPDHQATIGGVLSTGDSGPLRHRYGAPRDLVLGMTVALSDGTIARSGGKVIKNVAGYDLSKLYSGSFGTLGAIVEVAVRLHPLRETVSAAAMGHSPEQVASAARSLAHAQLEAQALDVAWREGQGGVLARFAGRRARTEALEAVALLSDAGLEAAVLGDDARAWEQQRVSQRGELVVRVSALQSQLADVMRAAEAVGGSMVGRAALGLCWVTLPVEGGAAAVTELRRALSPVSCLLLDAPPAVRAEVDPWDLQPGPELTLMLRTKERFDPARVCNPGLFAGGI